MKLKAILDEQAALGSKVTQGCGVHPSREEQHVCGECINLKWSYEDHTYAYAAQIRADLQLLVQALDNLLHVNDVLSRDFAEVALIKTGFAEED